MSALPPPRRTSDVIKRERVVDAPTLSVNTAQLMDAPLDPQNGIEVRNVSKRFRLSTESMGRMSSFLFHRLISVANREDFYALRDVSFDIKRGEMLGILGVNGSGKSTLLKLITGISTATSGEIRRLPRIAPLLDLSAGFHPSLSGYENIFLNGSIIGLQREEIRELLPRIIDFSGLDHKFLEAPVRTYSAGMMARLGFALAVSVDPDIILIDEVLAVGDLQFQAKSAQKLLEFRDQGKAMALVSHTSAIVGELCTDAIWLHKGVMQMQGYAPDVVAGYNAHLTEQVRRTGRRDQDELQQAREALRPHVVHFEKCRLLNSHGEESREFETQGHLSLSLELRADESTGPVDLAVVLQHQLGVVVEEFFASDRGFQPVALGRDRCRVTFVFEPLLLLPGEYTLEVAAIEAGNPEAVIGLSQELPLTVDGPFKSYGCYSAFVPVDFIKD